MWQQVSALTTVDDAKWPKVLPTNPHDPIREYCFQEKRYFMYCATPMHKNRQSRHFETMMLAITPRWVLQAFNSSQSRAERIKARIRKSTKKL
nr:YqcI/YcgG family protein [Aquibacillus sediminis]